jgi:hypothetical protein
MSALITAAAVSILVHIHEGFQVGEEIYLIPDVANTTGISD